MIPNISYASLSCQLAPAYISTSEVIFGSNLLIVVDTVTKLLLETLDKHVIISKLGETLSFGASPIETSLSQSIADNHEKNFKSRH